ncbi:MAG: tetratricopeptide repeat protein, partial [Spirochaetota bacterium]
MPQDSSLNLAIKYLHQKQYQKAEAIFQNLARTLPFDEVIVLYYGYTLIEQQKFEEALQVYRQYLSINS